MDHGRSEGSESPKVGKSGSREVRKSGSREVRKSGSPEVGKSGSREVRKSGSPEVGKSGSWEVGKLRSWEVGIPIAIGTGSRKVRKMKITHAPCMCCPKNLVILNVEREIIRHALPPMPAHYPKGCLKWMHSSYLSQVPLRAQDP